MFNCFPDADARAQAHVGPGLATPLLAVCEIRALNKPMRLLTSVCKHLQPDVAAPKAHQTIAVMYVSSTIMHANPEMDLQSLCKKFTWWAVTWPSQSKELYIECVSTW